MMINMIELWCDHFTEIGADHRLRCRTKNTFDGNRAEAKTAARQLGWAFKKGPRDYCPGHAFEHRQEPGR